MNKLQIVIIGGSIIIAILALILFSIQGPDGTGGQPGAGGELVMWGIDAPATFGNLLRDYESVEKTKITYVQRDPRTFSDDVVEALASRMGPDLVVAPSGWIEENHNKLAPLGTTASAVRTFETLYVDGASFAFVEKSESKTTIWALPLWVDPLVLYWNKDIFNAAGIPLPPAHWTDVIAKSKKIGEVGPGGSITRGGIALGRARNIPLFKEIYSLLMLQQGVSPRNLFLSAPGEEKNAAESALRFYTDFSKPGLSAYTWNSTLAEPREFFLQGKLGMMIDYASYASTLGARNPHLSFSIARAPQLEEAEAPIHFADFRGITVTAASKNNQTARNFAEWLAGVGASRELAVINGVAPARRDLLEDPQLKQLELFPLIVESSLNARRFHDPLQKESAEIVTDMIESVANGQADVAKAVVDARAKIERAYKDKRL